MAEADDRHQNNQTIVSCGLDNTFRADDTAIKRLNYNDGLALYAAEDLPELRRKEDEKKKTYCFIPHFLVELPCVWKTEVRTINALRTCKI